MSTVLNGAKASKTPGKKNLQKITALPYKLKTGKRTPKGYHILRGFHIFITRRKEKAVKPI